MKVTINDTVLELVKGDITHQATDAIVNAANARLRGGGGVDGAIHRAGGPDIMAQCRRLGGCPPGKAVITTAGELLAKNVTHTVGPIWQGGGKGEPEILANAYRNSLTLASEAGLETVAFPSISTGVYGYPVGKASRTALRTVMEFLKEHPDIKEVRFVWFNDDDLAEYTHALRELIHTD